MKLSNMPSISIIIPVLNEERYIVKLIDYIQKNGSSSNIKEILVVDGGSTDAIAIPTDAKTAITTVSLSNVISLFIFLPYIQLN